MPVHCGSSNRAAWPGLRQSPVCRTSRRNAADLFAALELLNMVGSKRMNPGSLITHHVKLDDILAAYHTFAHAADTRALKVIVEA